MAIFSAVFHLKRLSEAVDQLKTVCSDNAHEVLHKCEDLVASLAEITDDLKLAQSAHNRI